MRFLFSDFLTVAFFVLAFGEAKGFADTVAPRK
jgi:hypothetical protein